MNICGYVVISRVDRFEIVKTLLLGDCPHTPWAVKGYKQGRPLFLYSSVENLIQSLGTSPTLVMEGWKTPFTEVGHLILCGASKVDANYFRSSIVILKDLGIK